MNILQSGVIRREVSREHEASRGWFCKSRRFTQEVVINWPSLSTSGDEICLQGLASSEDNMWTYSQVVPAATKSIIWAAESKCLVEFQGHLLRPWIRPLTVNYVLERCLPN